MLRPLGTFERGWVLTDARSPFNVMIALRLENPPTPDVIQNALSILQKRHPLLRAKIKNGVFEHLANPKVSFEVIQSKSGHHWLEIVEKEMNTRVDLDGELFRGCYLSDVDHCDLILTFHHAIMDAASGNYLLDELLRICVGDQIPPLTTLEILPPVEERFPPAFKGIQGMARLMQYAASQMAEEIKYQWQVRGKRKPAIHLGGRGFPLTLILPEALVNQLSKRCRAEKVTLNSLLNVTLLLAVNRILYAGETQPMLTFAFADLRPYTVPPTPAENLANYISVLRNTLLVSGDSDIWSLAKTLHDKFYRSLKHGDKFNSSKMSETLVKMATKMKSMRMGTSAMNYSGAVALKTHYGNIKVTGLHAILSTFDLGPEVSAQTQLFNDELWMGFMFLETDMDRATAEKIVGEVKTILERAAVS